MLLKFYTLTALILLSWGLHCLAGDRLVTVMQERAKHVAIIKKQREDCSKWIKLHQNITKELLIFEKKSYKNIPEYDTIYAILKSNEWKNFKLWYSAEASSEKRFLNNSNSGEDLLKLHFVLFPAQELLTNLSNHLQVVNHDTKNMRHNIANR